LDYREKGGYERLTTSLFLDDGRAVSAVTYVATPENPNYVGPAPVEEIASVARDSHGPSGSNREYVIELYRALVAMGAEDEHVARLFDLVQEG
jgi:cation transport regulator ChaC